MHTVPLTHEPAVPEFLWGGKTAFHAPLAMLLKGDNPPVADLKKIINKIKKYHELEETPQMAEDLL